MNYKKLSLTAAIAVALTGCAPEEQEYDTLDKDLTEVQVQDWTPINRTPNEYYFIFDMRDKIPNQYFRVASFDAPRTESEHDL